MRKLSVSVVVLVVVGTAGCHFEVGAGTRRPVQSAPPAPAATATPAPVVHSIGKKPAPAPGTVTPTTPTVPGIPVLIGTNVFGSGTVDPAGWKGSFYNLNAGTTKLPTLSGVTPNGVLFAHELNVQNKNMTGGFPGIDVTRNENFGLRWEAPLIVDTESDYTFRLVSDDGAIFSIDGTTIVDNDGAHTVTDKNGPVHLVKGTHAIAVDYFQGTGQVALQLYCKKANGTEQICPTHLL